MRKLLILVISTILLLGMTTIAFAEGSTYAIEELNLEITGPDGWISLARNMEDDDPNLSKMGVEKQAVVDFLVKSNIYANFITEDQTLEIVVTMVQNDDVKKVFDFNSLNDKQLKEFADAMAGLDSEDIKKVADENSDISLEAYSGISFSGYEKYKHEQATFIVLDNFKNINGAPVHGKQYTTIINGHTISVSLNSYTSEVTDEADQVLKQVVDSVKFTKVEEKPKTGIDLYKAVQTGLVYACIFGVVGLLFGLLKNRAKKKEQAEQDNQ